MGFEPDIIARLMADAVDNTPDRLPRQKRSLRRRFDLFFVIRVE
jgi:hypothetical protein